MAKTADPVLSDLELKFCANYVQHCNASRAAREAGYEGPHLGERGYALLQKKHIQAKIKEMRGDLGELHYELADRVISRLTRMAEADLTAIFDADGNVMDPEAWPDDCKLLLSGIDIEERMQGEGDGAEMIRVKKVRFESRKAVMDTLLKTVGRWVEGRQTIGKDGKPVDPVGMPAPIVNITVEKA